MPALQLACVGLLGASLAAAPSLDLGVQAEGRHRTSDVPGLDTERMQEGELAPWFRLGLKVREAELTADYRPLLTLTNRTGGNRTFLHQAALAARWQLDPGWLASTSLEGRTGTVSLFQLLPGGKVGAPPAQPVPAISTLGYQSLVGTLGLGVKPGPRHRVQVTLTGALEGGAEVADQRLLPFQRRVQGLASLEWDAAPHDVLASVLDVTYADFSSGQRVDIALLTETWRREVSREVRLWAGGGAAVAEQRVDGVTSGRLLPTAEVGAGYDGRLAGLKLQGSLAFTVAPFVDRVTGAVPQRFGIAALLVAAPSPAWRIEGNASGGRVLEGDQRGDQVWGGGLQVSRALGEMVDVAAGVRGLMQVQPRFFTQTVDWHAFLSLAAHTRRPNVPAPPKPSEVLDPLRPGAEGGPKEDR